MLFRSLVTPSFAERLRLWLWPRRNWRRSATYVVKRILRLRATPHAIAAGAAAGVFSIVTPFFGFHMIIAVLLAYVIGGNLIAALISTWAGNPLTYPLIWVATFQFGNAMLGGAGLAESVKHGRLLMQDPVDAIVPVLVPMAAGAVPIGVAAAVVAYIVVRVAVQAYQAARQKT